jgi:multiple sugar transport system substrate-binding protein
MLLYTLLGALCLAIAEITLQAWSYHMPGEREFYDGLIADFERIHPGTRVNFSHSEWDNAHDEIAAWLHAGSGPDLIITPDIWLTEFTPHLDPYVDELPAWMKSEFFDALLQKAQYRGHTYGLVWATSTKALFCRTDLLSAAGIAAPPRDWDELLEAAIAIHRHDGPYGIGIPVKPTYESTDNWYFFFWSGGGEFFDEHGRAAVNSPIGLASLEFYLDLARRHNVTQPEPTSWSRKECRQGFVHERTAMHANGPWGVGDIRAANPTLQYTVVPLPVAPERLPLRPRRVTQVITDHLLMPAYCADRALAMDFIQFAYQDRYRQAFCQMGIVPEKKAVAASDFFQSDPDWKIFVDIIPDGEFIPLMDWEPVELGAQQMLYSVFTGRQEPQAALDKLAEIMDRQMATELAGYQVLRDRGVS